MEVLFTKLRERVQKGAAWLDANAPGWETRIDFGTLWMDQCTVCIIGQGVDEQLYDQIIGEGWSESRVTQDMQIDFFYAFMDGEERVRCGFSLGATEQDNSNWDMLGEVWRQFVKDRLDKGIKV